SFKEPLTSGAAGGIELITAEKRTDYTPDRWPIEAIYSGVSMRKQTAPNTVNSSVSKGRSYLTEREVERLMTAARKGSRWGHRDATMILVAYRHGLRACELCDLEWSQVELTAGRLHVRRAKNGTPSVHPIRGDELRALRRLQREQEASPFVFCS